MSDIIDALKTRGYSMVRIRPVEHIEGRFSKLADLESAVRNCAVELRGWSFPHYDFKSAPIRTPEYVEQALNWDLFVELWRAYKSGQFVSMSALWGEWRDQSKHWPAIQNWRPGEILGVEDAVFRFVEIYEFASRWARALSLGEEIVIETTLHRLQGRTLFSDRRPIWSGDGMVAAGVDEWTFKRQYATAALLASPRNLAVKPAIELFELFHWDVSENTIKSIQEELRR